MDKETKLNSSGVDQEIDHLRKSDPEKALVRINQTARKLERTRASLGESFHPTSLPSRAISFVADRIGIPKVSEWLTETPMARIRADLRSNILDLYQDTGILLKNHDERMVAHQSLNELRQKTIEDKTTENILELRETLRQEAEEDIDLDKDEVTEELLEKLLGNSTPEQQTVMAEKLIKEAGDRLQMSGTTIDALQSVILGTVQTYDNLMGTYSTVLELSPAHDALHRAAGDLIRAQSLNVKAFNTMLGELDLAILATRFAVEATQIGEELKRTANVQKLSDLQSRALDLQQRQVRAFGLTHETSKKLLTPGND